MDGGKPIIGNLACEIRVRKDDPRVGSSMTVEVHDEWRGTFRWVGVVPEDQGDGTVLLRLLAERAIALSAVSSASPPPA